MKSVILYKEKEILKMKKKLAIISLMLILVVTSLITTVNASSFSASFSTPRTTVAESNEFVVTIKISNLDVGTNGINIFEGVLTYSTQVFETLSDDSIDGNNGWQPSYNKENGKLMLYNPGFIKEDSDVAQITFKTKSGVTGKSGDIKLNNIKATNTEESIEANDISTKITIGNAPTGNEIGNQSGQPTNTNKPANQIIQRNTVNNNTSGNIVRNTLANNTNKNKTNTNTTLYEEDIPYTGASDNIMRAIFVVLVIAGISYFKYESIKEK